MLLKYEVCSIAFVNYLAISFLPVWLDAQYICMNIALGVLVSETHAFF